MSLIIKRIPLISYKDALQLQTNLIERVIDGTTKNTLLLLQHPPTFTTGKRQSITDLQHLAHLGAELYAVSFNILSLLLPFKSSYHFQLYTPFYDQLYTPFYDQL